MHPGVHDGEPHSNAGKQSEEIVIRLRGNIDELTDACLARTQVLAGSVCEISQSQRAITDNHAQHHLVLNDLVGQVQVLTMASQETKTNLGQGGWIDGYLTELKQNFESLMSRVGGLEERSLRMNDSMRDIGVETQAGHFEQTF